MNKSVIIVFGKPGAGKSYIAEILAGHFGYTRYSGDDAIPPDMNEALLQKAEISDDMRKRFLDNMITTIKKLSTKHEKLVVDQAFIKEFMRTKLLAEVPSAKFILVECDDALREKRYMERKYFNLGLPYLRLMTNLFEPVHIPHTVIYNDKEGTKDIIKQLQNI
jgi:gluconate kinase